MRAFLSPLRLSAARTTLLRILLIISTAIALTFGFVFLVEPRVNRQISALPATGSSKSDMATPFISPGIENPRTYPAATAPLNEEAEVIGVLVGTKARAYLVSAFSGEENHVVDDLLLGQPISVTHCDINDCTRVFTSRKRGEVLQIGCGGWYRGHLLLWTPKGVFPQESGDAPGPGGSSFPYEKFPCTITTWALWRKAHPETDVYVGGVDLTDSDVSRRD